MSSRSESRERRVPRYFFNLRDGRDVFDTVGTELSGVKQVRSHMIIAATSLYDEVIEIETHDEWVMEALDAEGKIVATLSFSAKKAGD